MDLGLVRKSVIISGGSKGIGKAIALELAAEGAHVAIAARGRIALDAVVAEITASGGSAVGIQADMTVGASVRAAVAEATRVFGAPDIAISNVEAPDARPGSHYHCGFDEAQDDDYVAAFNMLLMSVVQLTRAVLPAMKKKRWGRLLNIGSRCVKTPHAPPNTMILSNVNRLGVVGLMKTLSLEVGCYGITANVIATGRVATGTSSDYFAQQGMTVQDIEAGMRKAGIGVCRMGRPDELAALAAFLCSERASFISGETYAVTGGMQASMF
jgi:3-oxoacyl-[acyl-carrier protein] reductase